MSQLSHLDALEAEAIYIIREVAAECENALFHRKGQFGNASSCHESILSGEAAIPIFTCEHDMEIQGNDSVP